MMKKVNGLSLAAGLTLVAVIVFVLVVSVSAMRHSDGELLSRAEMEELGLSTEITEPCAPPCWQGLTPLESTQQEVMEVLSNSPFVDVESIESKIGDINDIPVSFIYWDEALREQGQFSTIIINEDGQLRFANILLQYQLTLQELIDSLGEPDVYVMIPVGEEVDCEYGRFLWPEQGFAAETDCIRRAEVLFPVIPVFFVSYYPPGPNADSYTIARWGRPDNAPFAKWRGFDQQ